MSGGLSGELPWSEPSLEGEEVLTKQRGGEGKGKMVKGSKTNPELGWLPAGDTRKGDKVGSGKKAQRPSMPLFEIHPENRSLRDFKEAKEGL